jgi:hypothetical protein
MPLPVVGPAVGLVPPMPPPVPEGTEAAYAAGPATDATTAAATEAANNWTRRPERKTSRPVIASAMTTATVGHSQVFQPEARRSSTTDQMPVAPRATGSTHTHRLSARKARSSRTPPPPHSAATPGARAVV